MTSTNTASTRR